MADDRQSLGRHTEELTPPWMMKGLSSYSTISAVHRLAHTSAQAPVWDAADAVGGHGGHGDKGGEEPVTEYACCFCGLSECRFPASGDRSSLCHTDVKAADGSTSDKHLKEIVYLNLRQYLMERQNIDRSNILLFRQL